MLIGDTPYGASMFRRHLWEAVGGFDESSAVAGCEDLDFWFTAMEQGFRGELIREPLLEFDGRGESVQQRLLSTDRQLDVKKAVFQKHLETVRKVGPRILVEKDRFLHDVRNHRAQLVQRASDLVQQLQAIEVQIAETMRQFTERGVDMID